MINYKKLTLNQFLKINIICIVLGVMTSSPAISEEQLIVSCDTEHTQTIKQLTELMSQKTDDPNVIAEAVSIADAEIGKCVDDEFGPSTPIDTYKAAYDFVLSY